MPRGKQATCGMPASARGGRLAGFWEVGKGTLAEASSTASPSRMVVQGKVKERREVCYQLVIEVPTTVRCAVGRLGCFEFPAGVYIYTGSAKRGLEARIARHRRADKKLRWHIDYLLAAPGVRITKVVRSEREECELNRALLGKVLVPGFGASDCRSGCGAHLKYLGRGRRTGRLGDAR